MMRERVYRFGFRVGYGFGYRVGLLIGTYAPERLRWWVVRKLS